jgi:hypothetical protein
MIRDAKHVEIAIDNVVSKYYDASAPNEMPENGGVSTTAARSTPGTPATSASTDLAAASADPSTAAASTAESNSDSTISNFDFEIGDSWWQ